MQVTNVRVSFLREKQPAQYEKAQPAVELTATLDPDDDHLAVARKLMIDATTVVYAGIGYSVPDKVAKALASGAVPPEVSVETSTDDDKPSDEKGGKSSDDKPKRRGRPPGSKNKNKEADSKKDNGDDIPGDEPQIRTNPEDRKNPDDEIPGDDKPSDEEESDSAEDGFDVGEENSSDDDFDAEDLHKLINNSIKAGDLTVMQAKQMQREMKVARVRDLDTSEKVQKAKKMIEAAIKANSAQK